MRVQANIMQPKFHTQARKLLCQLYNAYIYKSTGQIICRLPLVQYPLIIAINTALQNRQPDTQEQK